MLFADVVVELPVPKELTYSVPEELSSSLHEGSAVIAPLRSGKTRGYIVSLYRDEPMEGVKPLSALIEDIPPLPRELMDSAREVARHYLYTWGDVLNAAVPIPPVRTVKRFNMTRRGEVQLRLNKGDLPHKVLHLLHLEGELNLSQIQRRLKQKGIALLIKDMQKKGWVAAIGKQASPKTTKGKGDKPLPVPPELYTQHDLLPQDTTSFIQTELTAVWEKIKGSAFSEESRPLLLRSASTEEREGIYLLAAGYASSQGKSVIILKPEIAAAHPFIEKLKNVFNGRLFVTHSGLTPAGRWEQWNRAARTDASVVVGARATALQAVKNLGLIILDEEDDEAYKQEEIPRYHARDVALIRAQTAKCAVILGATVPSVESFHLAVAGKIQYIDLANHEISFRPEIEVIDLKQAGSRGVISPPLEDYMKETLKKGGQTLLFLNRRGYATFVQCRDCGFTLRCPKCDISLTYHTQFGKAKCRYCQHEQSTLLICPNCGGNRILYLGTGTQKVERDVRRLLPDASVCRFDSDAVEESGGLPATVEKIKKGEFQVVVSTQIGLPFLRNHNFTLAAVISADAILNLPDFRSAEKTFRLVHQLAGPQTGPSGSRKVVVQSFNADHYSLLWAQKLDYAGFYQEEIRRRQKLDYPPLARLISLRVEGGSKSGAGPLAATIAEGLRSRVPEHSDVSIMGPTIVHLPRTQSNIRWQILCKGKDRAVVEKLAEWALNQYAHRGRHSTKARVSVDVDPITLF